MASDPTPMPFSLLPERRPPWKEFAFSYVTQSALIALLVWIGTLKPLHLAASPRDYHAIALVSTPLPVNLRLPSPKPRVPVEEPTAPQEQMSASKPDLPASAPAIPRRLVQTN